MNAEDTAAVIAAAGRGTRMEAGRNKLLFQLDHQTVIEKSLQPFLKHPRIGWIYLVAAPRDFKALNHLVDRYELFLVEGGIRRQDSVHAALKRIAECPEPPDYVLIQDGARPFCSNELLDRVLTGICEKGSAIPVVPLTDTVRRIRSERCEWVDRRELYEVQTPQGFLFGDLWKASHRALREDWEVTDDASLLEKCGKGIHPVRGETGNLKITLPEDLEWARWNCSRKGSEPSIRPN